MVKSNRDALLYAPKFDSPFPIDDSFGGLDVPSFHSAEALEIFYKSLDASPLEGIRTAIYLHQPRFPWYTLKGSKEK